MDATKWTNSRSTKIRRYKWATMIRPSTAELRRWLRDKATPKHVKNTIYAWLLYRKQLLLFVLCLLPSLAIAGGSKPFVLISVLEHIGVAVLPATNSSACVVPGITYRIGKGMTITVTDPSLRKHLESFSGKTVRISMEEE